MILLTVALVCANSFPIPAKFCPRAATAATVLCKSSSCEELDDYNVGKNGTEEEVVVELISLTHCKA